MSQRGAYEEKNEKNRSQYHAITSNEDRLVLPSISSYKKAKTDHHKQTEIPLNIDADDLSDDENKKNDDTNSENEISDDDNEETADLVAELNKIKKERATALIEIPFENKRLAEIAFNSLSVDKGPKGEKKDLLIEDNKLICKFKAVDARSLRISVNSFLDFTNLVSKTIERFNDN